MPNPKNDTVLDISNLSFGYSRDKLLFTNLSLSINRGEIVTLLGESGSGKSTILELISNELKPLKGSITKGKISFIYQDPYSSFVNSYKILEQIGDVAPIINLDNYLMELDLDKKLLYKKPYELSGGQLQRCSILRAILMKPDLLLCDEPTSALDNITQLAVMKLLVKLIDRFGILLITHDLNIANWCSDKIIKIEDFK